MQPQHLISNRHGLMASLTLSALYFVLAVGAWAVQKQAFEIAADTASSVSVSGYTVSPTSGIAPLTIVVSYPAGTINEMINQSRGLVWGDGKIDSFSSRVTSVSKGIESYPAGTFTHTYLNSGSYKLKLAQCAEVCAIPTSGDWSGGTTLATITVSATVSLPSGYIITPTSGQAPLTVNVTGPSIDTSPNGSHRSINWGDESTADQSFNGTSVSHVYTKDGAFPITVTVGCTICQAMPTVTALTTVRVGSSIISPAGYSISPTSGVAPLAVTLNYPAAPARGMVVFGGRSVDWGDGTKQMSVPNWDPGLPAGTITHTYEKIGNFNIALYTCLEVCRIPPDNPQPIATVTVSTLSTPNSLIKLNTNKTNYNQGETITATLTNDSRVTVTFTSGCLIGFKNNLGRSVDPKQICTMSTVNVAPSQSTSESWDGQLVASDGSKSPAPAGTYKAVATYEVPVVCVTAPCLPVPGRSEQLFTINAANSPSASPSTSPQPTSGATATATATSQATPATSKTSTIATTGTITSSVSPPVGSLTQGSATSISQATTGEHSRSNTLVSNSPTALQLVATGGSLIFNLILAALLSVLTTLVFLRRTSHES